MGPANEESGEYAMIMNEGQEAPKVPLLGLSGEIPQPENRPIYFNLISGTGIFAQAGIWLLTMVIWGATFIGGFIFFSWHILLNSTGILLMTQAMLLLQPTHTPVQKRTGTAWHFCFNVGSLSALLAGLVIIEMNKFAHNGDHFQSLHAILGLMTYLLLLIQGVVGFTQYYTPMVYGSVDRAKSIWKYHRASGYLTIIMASLTIAAATQTGYNQNKLHIPLWFVLLALLSTLGGILFRVRLFKFGIGKK